MSPPSNVVGQPTKRIVREMLQNAELARTLQKTFCRGDVHIYLFAVWDTVPVLSAGFVRSRTLSCTTISCEHPSDMLYGGGFGEAPGGSGPVVSRCG
ncbi:hypothetical protein J3R83DRAFT_11545 [Lanmaoa asiatica]|nr:hypothetical protein J3R83DRAFT_11545 [Lanmaoa asiatica]